MQVKVRPINIKGRSQKTLERKQREAIAGALKVQENRMHAMGRVVVTATVLDKLSGSDTPLIEIYDVTLLWLDDKRMRLRGFEILDGTEYAQSWDVEIV